MTNVKLIESGGNAYLIKSNQQLFMIDTGDGELSKIERACQELDQKLEDIKFIFITHAHSDHVQNIKKLKMRTGAQVIAHKNAKQHLNQGSADFPTPTALLYKIISWFIKIFSTDSGCFPVLNADIYTENTFSLEKFGIPGSLHYTPGHTEDSVTILIQEHCFVGDTMFNIVPWTVFPIFANDKTKLKKSWVYIRNLEATEWFYPGHGEPFGLDKFLRTYQRVI